MGDTMTMTRELIGRADFLRGVQRAKRAADAGDVGAPLRFAAYIDTLEAFTDDHAEGAPALRLTTAQARAVENITRRAERLTADVRPSVLRELAQVLADRNGLRLADVLRLDVRDVATLPA